MGLAMPAAVSAIPVSRSAAMTAGAVPATTPVSSKVRDWLTASDAGHANETSSADGFRTMESLPIVPKKPGEENVPADSTKTPDSSPGAVAKASEAFKSEVTPKMNIETAAATVAFNVTDAQADERRKTGVSPSERDRPRPDEAQTDDDCRNGSENVGESDFPKRSLGVA
jgi:hypothetical protein